MPFSHDEYKESLRKFGDRVPELLNRHGETAALAIDVSKLELADQIARSRFRVAVVGRMKAGKSTLLNAVLGRRLAPVGVNETTATVNWFDYGEGEREGSYEIHWRDRDREIEQRDVATISNLVGHNNAEAGEIEFVRFYCKSSFLDGVTLIDTPGTQSTDDTHEQATTDLLTRKYGERADAIVLVLPTVIMEKDQKTLADFTAQSRFPGQGPYNTMAVMQKWETLADPEPEKKAWELAQNFKRRLEASVAEVLPVSGLLGIMSRQASEASLDRLVFLAARTESHDLDRLFSVERRFGQDGLSAALSGEERRVLFEDIQGCLLGAQLSESGNVGGVGGTWEMIRFATKFAHRRSVATEEKLRAALWGVSGLEMFQEVLQRRFFGISALIQAGSVLKRALDPCREARYRLREGLTQRRDTLYKGDALEKRLREKPNSGELERASLAYLACTQSLIGNQIGSVNATLRELEGLIRHAEDNFDALLAEIKCLDLIASGNSKLPEHCIQAARCLFGQYGMERHSRLGLDGTSTVPEQSLVANKLHSEFALMRRSNPVADRAADRAHLILLELEELTRI